MPRNEHVAFINQDGRCITERINASCYRRTCFLECVRALLGCGLIWSVDISAYVYAMILLRLPEHARQSGMAAGIKLQRWEKRSAYGDARSPHILSAAHCRLKIAPSEATPGFEPAHRCQLQSITQSEVGASRPSPPSLQDQPSEGSPLSYLASVSPANGSGRKPQARIAVTGRLRIPCPCAADHPRRRA
jgi:hypothetical protein